MNDETKYRIISDGKRFRAQSKALLGWHDLEHETRYEDYVGKAYRWRWQAEFKIWREKRRRRWWAEYMRKMNADKNAIWEKL